MVVRAVSPTLTADRTYWHVPGWRSWHAQARPRHPYDEWSDALCGRTVDLVNQHVDTADRVPPNGHLCGSCARVIAARTDVEA